MNILIYLPLLLCYFVSFPSGQNLYTKQRNAQVHASRVDGQPETRKKPAVPRMNTLEAVEKNAVDQMQRMNIAGRMQLEQYGKERSMKICAAGGETVHIKC